ncbi:SHOCT domain-containing protein [Clostridium sp. ZS2-4]|uniref:SHOCT domain-containing protein n=1 Tax=Clostridium sp. ZS2-4 TaxID=2987703 RepID=UPI00227C76E2|nr:SHOCT domain-containing protein [Clostridium sp. ZS2-4]MCY6354350.1 SHOCT domain-containing protein [Clostridium sp. ZS2-4]
MVDNRQTILAIKKDTQEKYSFFSSESYDVFLKLISQKEFNIAYKQSSDTNINSSQEDIYFKIEKLADLKEKDIITDEEFNEKKRKLLDEM